MTLRFCLELTAIACTAAAYQGVVRPQHLGHFETGYVGTDIQIREGDQEWNIRMEDLPIRPIDCEMRRSCSDTSLRGCSGMCVWGASILTIDEARRIAYFAVATGTAQNKPWIVFGYRLETRSVFRLTNEWGGGFGPAAVSPGGQYLAYVFYPHTPAVCPPRSWLGVVNIQTRRSATVTTFGSAGDAAEIRALRWNRHSEVVYEEDSLPANACNDSEGRFKPRHVTGTIDARQITFKLGEQRIRL